jgi:hypothetical protein
MNIRVNKENYEKLLPLWEKNFLNREVVTFEESEDFDAVILTKNKEGNEVVWFNGQDHVESFMTYGYVRIAKFCPLIKDVCMGEKCAFYVVQKNIGDCAQVWQAVK